MDIKPCNVHLPVYIAWWYNLLPWLLLWCVELWPTTHYSQRHPKCHQFDNTAFRRRRQDSLTTLAKLPFAELPLQCLDIVGDFGPVSLPPNTAISLSGGILHSNYPLPLEVRAIPHRSQTLLKTLAFSWKIPSRPPPIAKRQPLKPVRCCLWYGGRSVNYPYPRFPPPFITRWFGPILNTQCRPTRRTVLPTPIAWSKSSGWRWGS